jgi:hypothetical protein
MPMPIMPMPSGITFGTQSVADEVPIDVAQKVLGHASLQTTAL